MDEPFTPKHEEQAAQEASQNLDFFWGQIADEETLGRLTIWDKRLMAEASLWLSLGTPTLKADPETQRKLRYEEFTDWYPKSAKEAFTATHFGFARKSFSALKGFWADARDDLDNLSRGVRTDGTDVNLIRANQQILYTMADNLMARESWINGRWPHKNSGEYANRRRYWRGQMLAAGEFAGDEVLIRLFAQEFSEAVARDSYWTLEFQIMPSSAGRIAASGTVQISNELQEKPSPEPSDASQGETKFINMMPSEEREQLLRRKKKFASLWERLDHAGMPQAEKMARIWREFPEFKPPEIAYAEGLRDLAIKRAKDAAKAGNPKRKSPVRYASPRDKGAPPHIAREIRGE